MMTITNRNGLTLRWDGLKCDPNCDGLDHGYCKAFDAFLNYRTGDSTPFRCRECRSFEFMREAGKLKLEEEDA